MLVDIFFRSIDCKPPIGDVADVGHLYDVRKYMISQQSQYELPRSPMFLAS